jgi:hypothetical protein
MAINPTTESLFIALILEQQKMINKLIARELTDGIIARQEHLDDTNVAYAITFVLINFDFVLLCYLRPLFHCEL